MNKQVVLKAVLCAALAAGVSVSRAAAVTLTGWTYGAGHQVAVNTPAYGGLAGGFTGSLAGAGAFDSLSFQTYCIELTESFSFGAASMLGYEVVDGDIYFGAVKANQIGRLISYVMANPGAVDDSHESTSLQLALWNLVYDGDASLSSGVLTDSSGYASSASTLLTQSLLTASVVDVFALRKDGKQDFLLTAVRPPGSSTNQVSEPTSLALGSLALLAAMGLRRRQRLQ